MRIMGLFATCNRVYIRFVAQNGGEGREYVFMVINCSANIIASLFDIPRLSLLLKQRTHEYAMVSLPNLGLRSSLST